MIETVVAPSDRSSFFLQKEDTHLSNEELVKLIQDGEMERIEELYNQTYPLIYKVCSRFFGLEDTQDLLQEGYIALYKAALVYDPSRGASFSTVLYMVVRQSLKRYLSECGSVVRLPEYKRTLCFVSPDILMFSHFHSSFTIILHNRSVSITLVTQVKWRIKN